MEVPEANLEALRRGNAVFSRSFTVPPGRYGVELAVLDQSAKRASVRKSVLVVRAHAPGSHAVEPRGRQADRERARGLPRVTGPVSERHEPGRPVRGRAHVPAGRDRVALPRRLPRGRREDGPDSRVLARGRGGRPLLGGAPRRRPGRPDSLRGERADAEPRARALRGLGRGAAGRRRARESGRSSPMAARARAERGAPLVIRGRLRRPTGHEEALPWAFEILSRGRPDRAARGDYPATISNGSRTSTERPASSSFTVRTSSYWPGEAPRSAMPLRRRSAPTEVGLMGVGVRSLEDHPVRPADLVPRRDPRHEGAPLVLGRPVDRVLAEQRRVRREGAPHLQHGTARPVRCPGSSASLSTGVETRRVPAGGTSNSCTTEPTRPEFRSRTTILAW